ncbi:hypothetical protein [Paenibacillus kobensis]|uniref:hypothetical protein n=1 Tax=Paenibacillus kobensis TaxID=59841 RepID=UPI000FD769FA|nr:hypothetical protein [Paenibacillus kobensis]
MSKDAKSDIIAVVLMAFVISVLFGVTWINKATNDSGLTRFTEVSEHLNRFVREADSLAPQEIMNAELELDPKPFTDAAAYAPDYGTANEMLYIAELIKQYNDGADIQVLHEAIMLLNEIMPHIRETL